VITLRAPKRIFELKASKVPYLNSYFEQFYNDLIYELILYAVKKNNRRHLVAKKLYFSIAIPDTSERRE
jgi:hypothetical protein